MPDVLAPPVLAASGLRKTFRVGRRQLTALDGVDLTIGRGETVGLVGESGCGKSTLARVLLMLARPDDGTVRFGDVDLFTLRGKKLLAWRRRVQMVFQDPYASLNERMTAEELIGEPCAPIVTRRRRTGPRGCVSCWSWWGCGRVTRTGIRVSSPVGSGSGSGSRGRWR
jgi:ABC-type oligopeptide transport system ATPase subunit